MATFKHISSKNADYGAAEQYLTFEHDEFTMKPSLDGNGQIVPRTGYLISSLNCGDEDFAIACMRSNLKYGKNQKREDVKSHHYIISFDPRDAPDNGLTVDRAHLGQLGLEPHFFSGDSKRLLQKGIEAVCTEQKKKVVCVLDEAHLLGKDMLEELRFFLNYKFDSSSPMSLVLVEQTELWEQQLRLQAYTAIRQRIDMNIVLGRLDRAETGKYIAAHLTYAGTAKELFTSDAEDEIYKVSAGVPRMINRICEKTLMYAYQQQKRLADGHMVRFVADHEMPRGVE